MDRPENAHLLHVQQQHGETNPFSRPGTPGHHAVQIGFVGLGAMGYPMARNLAKWRKEHVHGSLPILVWNRTKAKADELTKETGEGLIVTADSVEHIANECDIIITNLANDEVVRTVYQQFAQALEVSMPFFRGSFSLRMLGSPGVEAHKKQDLRRDEHHFPHPCRYECFVLCLYTTSDMQSDSRARQPYFHHTVCTLRRLSGLRRPCSSLSRSATDRDVWRLSIQEGSRAYTPSSGRQEGHGPRWKC